MTRRALAVLAPLILLGGGVAVYAQLENSGERGVPVLDSQSSLEVGGIPVDVYGADAQAARLGGWRLAQRKAWAQLWAKTHGGSTDAPAIGDSALDSIVSGIVVEDEQIGARRYVARLGVLFDRSRAGELLGASGEAQRSPPLLVIPVQWTAGTPVSFEQRSEWQQAWARFRASASPIDYVRPNGASPDPLLLTFGQTQRPGRNWWRMLLDFYGTSDVVIPEVRLQHLYPGGPVIGRFTARYGPDNRVLGSFALRTSSPDGVPALMDQGVQRIDQLYTQALRSGILRTDPSLIVEEVKPVETEEAATTEEQTAPAVQEAATTAPASASFQVQFESPEADDVSAVERAVRGAAGVTSASTTSLALGGVSLLRVSFQGDLAALRTALANAGLRVEERGGALLIRRTPAAE